MRQSKLLELLRHLPAVRWRRFGEFVQSPYWNKNKDIRAFYQFLSAYHPKFDHPDLDKKNVVARLAPIGAFTEKNLAHLMSRLTELAETFISMETLRETPALQEWLHLNALQQSKLPRLFAAGYEKWRKNLPDETVDHLRQFEIDLWAFKTLTDPRRLGFNPYLQKANDRLDELYLLHKLRLLAAIHNVQRLIDVQYNTLLDDELETLLLQNPQLLVKRPIPAIWFFAWQLNRGDDPAWLEQLLPALDRHADKLEPSEQKELYIYTLNFCTRRINLYNEQHYYARYLELHETLLEKGLLLEQDRLQPHIYLNLVYAGLRSGRSDWTWHFLHHWRSKLPPESQENLFAYGLSQFHYFHKNYDQAQKTLACVEFEDVLLAVSARSLMVKILWETRQTELLFAQLEANRLFLHRNKQLGPRLRRQMQQFVDFTRRLAKIDPPDPAKRKALAERLPPATEIMHRDWLAEMIG